MNETFKAKFVAQVGSRKIIKTINPKTDVQGTDQI